MPQTLNRMAFRIMLYNQTLKVKSVDAPNENANAKLAVTTDSKTPSLEKTGGKFGSYGPSLDAASPKGQ
jgi:hypothetical protein